MKSGWARSTSARTTTRRNMSRLSCPSKVPNLLVNGSAGIAVGMATNIPPHNLGEVCNALLKVLEDPEIKDYQLVANGRRARAGFPDRRQVLNTRDELREIYKTGQGAIKDAGDVRERRCHPLGADHPRHQHPVRREQGGVGRGDRPKSSSAERCPCCST